jgi:hypothetical protein
MSPIADPRLFDGLPSAVLDAPGAVYSHTERQNFCARLLSAIWHEFQRLSLSASESDEKTGARSRFLPATFPP